MRFERFSPKQLSVLTWWCPQSPHRERDALICDGAVRSGKTVCLSLSFALWAMAAYNGAAFALCGKTITALRRNVVAPLMENLPELGISCALKASRNLLELGMDGRKNIFYLFGGRDEGSAALIQGVTLAGVLFDEVALMPRSFVEQALARCSVEGSRFWFNCNPEYPGHWFYTEWIQKAEERNALYLHFTMKDNPSLSQAMLRRYRKLYSGVFYRRYVKGEWVRTQGAVYPMFSREEHVVSEIPACSRYVISCDYGTVNPASFGLWGQSGGVWYRAREYYYDSRREGAQKTDEEYAAALEALAGDLPIEAVVADPSAASFIQCVRRRGKYRVVPAKNAVTDGIRMVAGALKSGRLKFHEGCADCIREFELYRWEDGANGSSRGDIPRKENDHAMDDMRYFAQYALGDGDAGGFWALSAERH
jgi:PBSX family phage terminase large subunit